MPTTDTALYIGEAGKVLASGQPLIPGITVAFVPVAEARASDMWDPIEAGRPSSSSPPSVSDGGTPSNTRRHEISSTTGEDIQTTVGAVDGGNLYYSWDAPILSSPTTINIPTSGSGYQALNDSTDYIINLPATDRTGYLQIVGGRNIQIRGSTGKILAPATADNWVIYLQDGASPVSGRIIDMRDITLDLTAQSPRDAIAIGTPSAIVQLQNIKVLGVHDTSAGPHADIIQTYSSVQEIRIDRLTGTSTYQGLTFLPSGATPAPTGITCRRVNLTLNANGVDTYTQIVYIASQAYPGGSGPLVTWPITFDQVYINNTKGGQTAQNAIFPDGSASPPSTYSGGVVAFGSYPNVTGTVVNGVPAGGDFATGAP